MLSCNLMLADLCLQTKLFLKENLHIGTHSLNVLTYTKPSGRLTTEMHEQMIKHDIVVFMALTGMMFLATGSVLVPL